MRRDIGAVLVGLGVFLMVIAITVLAYVSGQVLKFPLNFYYTATLVSPNTTYFNASTLSEVTGATVNGIYTLKGNASAGNSSTAVWDEFTDLHDASTGAQILIQTRAVAFDRKTAALVNCCGQNVNGTPANVSGIAGFVFPIGTQQQSYQVYNTTTMKPESFSYAGTDTVNGISTYKYVEYIYPTNIGFSPLSTTEPLFYGINLTYWIDPDTGVLLKILEHQQEYLVDPNSGATTTVLFDGTLSPTPASVASIVAIDGSGRLKITLVHVIIPVVAGLLGAALLVWGLVLYSRVRPDVSQSGFETMTRELTGRAQDSGPASPSAGGGRHAAGATRPAGVVPGMDGEPEPASTTADRPGGEDPEAPGP